MQNKINNEPIFEDSDDFSFTKENVTFESIVLDQLRKCIHLRSSGKLDNYIEAVISFSDLLHFHYDDIMKKAEEEYHKQEQNIMNKKKTDFSDYGIRMTNTHKEEESNFETLQFYIVNKFFRSLCDFAGRKKYFAKGKIEA